MEIRKLKVRAVGQLIWDPKTGNQSQVVQVIKRQGAQESTFVIAIQYCVSKEFCAKFK